MVSRFLKYMESPLASVSGTLTDDSLMRITQAKKIFLRVIRVIFYPGSSDLFTSDEASFDYRRNEASKFLNRVDFLCSHFNDSRFLNVLSQLKSKTLRIAKVYLKWKSSQRQSLIHDR